VTERGIATRVHRRSRRAHGWACSKAAHARPTPRARSRECRGYASGLRVAEELTVRVQLLARASVAAGDDVALFTGHRSWGNGCLVMRSGEGSVAVLVVRPECSPPARFRRRASLRLGMAELGRFDSGPSSLRAEPAWARPGERESKEVFSPFLFSEMLFSTESYKICN